MSTADLVFGAGGVGLVLLVSLYLATREALVVSLREQSERARHEQQLRDEQARAAERTRIAREMHDVLAHKMSLIALHAGALELHSTGHATLHEGAGLIRATAREALQELRDVLGILRQEPVPVAGPIADLTSLAAASREAGQQVELLDDVGSLPPATARVVHRVVQEGLTNAAKHAPGARATVSVRRTGTGSVGVTVGNVVAAAPPQPPPASGFGLIGLAERIRLVGGTLRSGPVGGGWELYADVPWLDQGAEVGEAGAQTG